MNVPKRLPMCMRLAPSRVDGLDVDVAVEAPEPSATSRKPTVRDGLTDAQFDAAYARYKKRKAAGGAASSAPPAASGLASGDPAAKAKAMWAANTDDCRKIFDSEENLAADLRHPEPVRAGRAVDTEPDYANDPSLKWSDNIDHCRERYGSYTEFIADLPR